MNDENIIVAKLKKLDTNQAIITIDDDYEIKLPLKYIPTNVGEGDVLHIIISNPLNKQKKPEPTKELLNEILKPNN